MALGCLLAANAWRLGVPYAFAAFLTVLSVLEVLNVLGVLGVLSVEGLANGRLGRP